MRGQATIARDQLEKTRAELVAAEEAARHFEAIRKADFLVELATLCNDYGLCFESEAGLDLVEVVGNNPVTNANVLTYVVEKWRG